jgi:hypothetical protein
MATNDELVRDMVKNVVSSADVYKVKPFKVGSVHFHPVMFVSLITLIEFGKIHFKFVTVAGASDYYSGNNTFEFGFTTASSLSQKALVLHEATHAVLDIVMAPGMKVVDSEAMAYIVQCQYARANNTVAGTRLVGEGKKDRVFATGWSIAGKLLAGRSPRSEDFRRLSKAISKHPEYKNIYRNAANWDGVF